MTDLTGRKPKNSYKDLLQIPNSNAGIDTTLRAIEDGASTASVLYLSTTAVEARGAIQLGTGGTIDLDGKELILDADGDTSITADTDDQISIKVAGQDDFTIRANEFEVLSGSSLLINGTLDANGKEIILDTDGDTSITADTDDEIHFRLAGADDFKMTANTFEVLAGSTLLINGSLDANGNEVILDADGDTSLHCSSDDQVDVKVAGSDDFRFTANTFEVLSGSSILVNGSLDVNGTELVLDADADTTIHCSTDDLVDFKVGGNDRFTLNGAGGFNIGNASYPFASASTPRGSIAFDLSGDVMLYVINSASSSPFGMVVNFSGASPDNTTQYFFRCQDSTADRFKVFSDGDAVNHDNSYGAISDARLKQDIAYVGPYANADGTAMPVVDGDGSYCALFKKFRPAHYRFKSDVSADPDTAASLGLIAQDVKQFAPGLVQGTGTFEDLDNPSAEANDPYSVQYSLISMQLVPVVQELIGRIEALEAA